MHQDASVQHFLHLLTVFLYELVLLLNVLNCHFRLVHYYFLHISLNNLSDKKKLLEITQHVPCELLYSFPPPTSLKKDKKKKSCKFSQLRNSKTICHFGWRIIQNENSLIELAGF